MTFSIARHRRLILLIGLVGSMAARSVLAETVIEIGSGAKVVGSGRVVDDARNVSGYSRVIINGGIDVQLKHTGSEKAVVHADDNIAPLIETRVEGDKLFVETRKDAAFRTRTRLLVVVEFKQLDAIQLQGSGDVQVDDIKAGIFQGTIQGSGDLKIARIEADTVALSIAGSGNFDARGRAGKLGVVIEGSGDVKAEDLKAKTAAVSIAGSGDARVHATESLQARISGSGDVRYRGSPRVEKMIAGSGDVKPMH
jgi:hypothetical protein